MLKVKYTGDVLGEITHFVPRSSHCNFVLLEATFNLFEYFQNVIITGDSMEAPTHKHSFKVLVNSLIIFNGTKTASECQSEMSARIRRSRYSRTFSFCRQVLGWCRQRAMARIRCPIRRYFPAWMTTNISAKEAVYRRPERTPPQLPVKMRPPQMILRISITRLSSFGISTLLIPVILGRLLESMDLYDRNVGCRFV